MDIDQELLALLLESDDEDVRDEARVCPPEKLEGVRSLYADREQSEPKPLGYSHRPANGVVHPLCRVKYPTLGEAEARYQQLAEQNGWRYWGVTFWDARNWARVRW